MSRIVFWGVLISLLLSSAQQSAAAETKLAWQIEWEKTIDAAKKESKVVAGVPASAELRKSLEETFAKRFPGVEIEISTARGPTNASKIAAEHAAGVRYYDVLISGSLTPLSLLNAGILEPIEPLLILPEVKEAKRWYGGHIFSDNAKRFLYSFQAYQSENLWHNTQLMKADEFRSFDDLLNPKWKSKIGILDPRSAGGGTSGLLAWATPAVRPAASPTFSAIWLWFPPNSMERNLEPNPSEGDPTLFEKSPRTLLRMLLSFMGPVISSKICLKNPVWPALPAKPPKIAAAAV